MRAWRLMELLDSEPYETLDPQDWSAFRQLAHRMVDDMLGHLEHIAETPAWQPIPESSREALQNDPLPRKGVGAEAAYGEFVRHVMPYTNGNLHPRFWGWVQGNGTPLAMMADMLASGINPHMAGFNQAPRDVELRVIAWLAELMGIPEASGLLVSGGTMANVIGLAVARNGSAGFDVRELGVCGGPRLTVYCSTETHNWAQKAVELLGIGNASLRRIDVDDTMRMDIARLKDAIRDDHRAGLQPLCVIGTAGTVNTGAIDDLSALADLCRDEHLWFHVDGAFGALARLSPQLQPLVAGMERADSLAFDLHKWMYLPFEIACVLVRDADVHRNAFALTASYLQESTRGVIAGGLPFAERGVELTRGFKALKAWMTLKAHGVDTFTRLIERNVEQARYVAARVDESPELQRLADVPLNIVCFRFAPDGIDELRLDAINRELLLLLQERGIAVPSGTTIGGRYALRIAITNHRSKQEDFDALLEAVQNIGRELAGR